MTKPVLRDEVVRAMGGLEGAGFRAQRREALREWASRDDVDAKEIARSGMDCVTRATAYLVGGMTMEVADEARCGADLLDRASCLKRTLHPNEQLRWVRAEHTNPALHTFTNGKWYLWRKHVGISGTVVDDTGAHRLVIPDGPSAHLTPGYEPYRTEALGRFVTMGEALWLTW